MLWRDALRLGVQFYCEKFKVIQFEDKFITHILEVFIICTHCAKSNILTNIRDNSAIILKL